jgi:K+/H+ antiporter YhaU regulatory subunit KhtT
VFLSTDRSIFNKIINEVATAKTERIFGKVLGQIGFRFKNGAKISSITKNAE